MSDPQVDWRAVADRLAEALRLTREYVGGDLLPNLPGWEHYDAMGVYIDATNRAHCMIDACPFMGVDSRGPILIGGIPVDVCDVHYDAMSAPVDEAAWVGRV